MNNLEAMQEEFTKVALETIHLGEANLDILQGSVREQIQDFIESVKSLVEGSEYESWLENLKENTLAEGLKKSKAALQELKDCIDEAKH